MSYRKKLPIGVDNFEKLIQEDFFYVDKTGMIAELLKNWSEVNLFTRPRRFGKSLNMSMLKTFFEIGCDKTLFQGLKISEEKELCKEYMGQFPVISISLKGVEGLNEEMVSLIRNLFGNALKTNSSLYFAILTGCLRVFKESIFTGLNNLRVMSITNVRFEEYFGFTDSEVKEMLNYYGLMDHFDTIKAWYDGYRFGNKDVYCPWDVLSHCDNLRADPDARPEDYWSNTSGNAIVRRFIDLANSKTKDEIECLIAGETILKEINQELTYGELDNSIENLWSVLFTTGYLTQRGRADGDKYYLVIPNYEIKKLFIRQIREWFRYQAGSDRKTLDKFCNAFSDGDGALIEELFNDYLWNTISIRDTAAPNEKKENFYHGILLGILGFQDDWIVKSNAESGIGYSDILIETRRNRIGIVVEIKYAEDGNLEAACEKALRQIEDKKYEARLKEDGMRSIIKYGIACYKKECKVKKGDA